MRLLITVFTAAITLVALASVVAADSSVQITALDCGSHPRRMRIENLGDAAQDLTGWQLQSDPVEGGPFDLDPVGSIDAGQKFFVFQGHLSPAVNPAAGYYRWGTDEVFNLRANDSSDYVRLVDAQGNTVDQVNCEGLPPGATPAPTTEFDPPPLVVATDTPAPTQAPAATAAPAPTSVRTSAPSGATSGGTSGGTAAGGAAPEVPAAGGGPPLAPESAETLALAAAMVLMSAGALMTTAGIKRREPGD